MAEIINLRRARKAKARVTAANAADAARALFGRNSKEREASAAETGRQARALDGARRHDR